MIAAFIQARMGSTRLPGKVLLPLAGRPMLGQVCDRAARARSLDLVAVVTGDDSGNDPIAEFCADNEIACFRGSEKDVLGRYVQAARHFDVDIVVRITADCPLIDPEVIDLVVDRLGQSGGADFASNVLERTFPRGLDAEAATRDALERAGREARQPSDRTHVMPYIYRHPDQFQLVSVTNDADLSRHRWTVDTLEDLEFIRAVYGRLADGCGRLADAEPFGWRDVLALLEREPSIMELNRNIRQKELDEG